MKNRKQYGVHHIIASSGRNIVSIVFLKNTILRRLNNFSNIFYFSSNYHKKKKQ